ncbi:E3 ubiquitin-protein ligase MARCHF2-like isoform X1 [Metopolophium dirhodum]|uniref:E3 ubiquitin-protein ligase MARCHF2-like isoform X1 n=1 Tax=Metopolophium dirhodum TaxID=44670 RepID=UPI00298FE15D|nr:E3 ubiquitin-protein ligase MARCHF2-like isoform X1 [Metopolophium dirhodum]XP_060857882.1 E3 ubiquitin-protein ligase MARCHF2-like isoform X1 [Metopolophium dirhodum]XP_060857883.1 E3 ubiquitin-protein ligase MARCHF2-like isoform X1 [Metopolophium dirhodum]XP_060857884.1 E3 ubiquitin-protein ligase MARCHF2-like isoform X1 [Metopolophium dirhodum]XP_060857886.1 E3 ubiquitin-protein ligase MARCHF2-like isoform X1 [Metopolophium dirhodum]XP_060857887.1 E3 ubiquitin-protein ligase MARCHF2-like
MTYDNMYRAVQRSEEEAVQMEPFSDDSKRHGQGDSQDIDECDENDKLIMCRICYDVFYFSFAWGRTQLNDDKKENTVSPCNCVGSHAHVHVTCLEQWLSVSKSSTCDICSYTFKTIERSLTIHEWLRERRTCQGFCQQFTVMFFFVAIWGLVLIACGLKTIEYFLDTNDKNSVSNGFLMTIITFAMAAMLWFWLVIFSSIWKRMNMVIRLDKNYLNGADDINNAFAV